MRYGRAFTAYQAGFDVNSSDNLWCCSVLESPALLRFFNVKDLLCPPRTGSGKVSVTNMRLVSTGIALSSPSAKSPASATMRWVRAIILPAGIFRFQAKRADCPASVEKLTVLF